MGGVVHTQHVNSLACVPAVMWMVAISLTLLWVWSSELKPWKNMGTLVLRMRAPSASASFRSMKLAPAPLSQTASFCRRLWWAFGLVERAVTLMARGIVVAMAGLSVNTGTVIGGAPVISVVAVCVSVGMGVVRCAAVVGVGGVVPWTSSMVVTASNVACWTALRECPGWCHCSRRPVCWRADGGGGGGAVEALVVGVAGGCGGWCSDGS